MRSEIRSKMPNKKTAAGFVLLREFEDGIKALCLYDKDGKCDIPKGRRDNHDLNSFHTAQRECFEEVSIIVTKTDVISDDRILIDDRLTVFCAMTDQDVEIKKNPENQKYEHIAYEWIDISELFEKLPNYLKPACIWAQDILDQYLTMGAQEQ